MSYMKKLHHKAGRTSRGGGGKKKTPAGRMSIDTFPQDMKEVLNDLNGKRLMQATKAMSFIARQQTVNNLRKGSSATVIGESQKSKMTRGDWKAGIKRSKSGGKYLKGGWAGEVLEKRGADKKTMAFNGGDTKNGRGSRGIISRTVKRKRIGWVSITGPRYGTDAQDDSKAGYNYAHTLEYGAAHKAWDNPAGRLRPRPFLGPAAAMSRNKQVSKLKKMFKAWGNGQ
jgi:hypothetical protein